LLKRFAPFVYDRRIFAHNGSVDWQQLLALLEDDHVKALAGRTDSEVYFHLILQYTEQESDVVLGIEKAITEIKKHDRAGLNFILTKPGRDCPRMFRKAHSGRLAQNPTEPSAQNR
jgi:predicted glutamine amidotransferase